MSRKAQAGKKDAADVAAFPCAEQRSRAARLRLRDAAFAGRRLGPQECPLEHPSPAAALAQYFRAPYYLRFTWWQRHDLHLTDGETRRSCSSAEFSAADFSLSPAVGQLVAWPCAAAQPSENGLTEEPDSLIEAPGDLGSRFSRFSSTCVFI